MSSTLLQPLTKVLTMLSLWPLPRQPDGAFYVMGVSQAALEQCELAAATEIKEGGAALC